MAWTSAKSEKTVRCIRMVSTTVGAMQILCFSCFLFLLFFCCLHSALFILRGRFVLYSQSLCSYFFFFHIYRRPTCEQFVMHVDITTPPFRSFPPGSPLFSPHPVQLFVHTVSFLSFLHLHLHLHLVQPVSVGPTWPLNDSRCNSIPASLICPVFYCVSFR